MSSGTLFSFFSGAGRFLLSHPGFSALFSVMAGLILGKIRFGRFRVGNALGTLIFSLFLSVLVAPFGSFVLDKTIKSVAFAVFVIAVFYEAGTEFFRSLRGQVGKLLLLSLIYGILVFLISFVIFRFHRISAPEGAGIIAGAATQTAILASAGVLLSDAEQAEMAVSYAVTYVFGLAGTMIVLHSVIPALLHVRLSSFRSSSSGKAASRLLSPKTVSFLKTAGLSLFMAGVGLVAGAGFTEAFREMGLPVILTGLLITLLPHILSALFGCYVLKLSVLQVLGTLAGASTCGAALDGLLTDAGEDPALTGSFAVGYAMGNILLTLIGPLCILLLS